MQSDLPIWTALAVSVAAHVVVLTNLPGFGRNHQAEVNSSDDLPLSVLISLEDEGGGADSSGACKDAQADSEGA